MIAHKRMPPTTDGRAQRGNVICGMRVLARQLSNPTAPSANATLGYFTSDNVNWFDATVGIDPPTPGTIKPATNRYEPSMPGAIQSDPPIAATTRTVNVRVSPGRMLFGGGDDSRAQNGNHALLHASPLRASTREAQNSNVNASDPALCMV